MTYEEALDFFARYGNVSCDVERLKLAVPTMQQLQQAARRSLDTQPIEIVEQAVKAILDHCEMLEEPKNESVVRPAVVESMIATWQKGEIFNLPYSRAEVRAAERRWVEEERTCSSAPKRSPWAIQLGG